MRIWMQWTDEHRTTRKTGSGRRKVTSARDDQHLLRMAVNDSFLEAVGSTLIYCYRYINVVFVNLSTSAAPWIECNGAFIQILLTANHRWLSLQWAHEHRTWQADWHQVVFSYEPRFNLWDRDGRIRVRRSACERCLPECVIERQSGLTPGVMQDNARPHVAKTVRDFYSAQHMQILPRPAYSLDMSPIENVRDFLGRHLAGDPRPAASKDKLLLRIQAIWNSLPQADIQNLFDSIYVV
ncbi:transposable element Tcb2 transposase [Trichonephila clavipes]|nr:transposable element Tcb2 transposase [Trichonephila clavipes]